VSIASIERSLAVRRNMSVANLSVAIRVNILAYQRSLQRVEIRIARCSFNVPLLTGKQHFASNCRPFSRSSSTVAMMMIDDASAISLTDDDGSLTYSMRCTENARGLQAFSSKPYRLLRQIGFRGYPVMRYVDHDAHAYIYIYIYTRAYIYNIYIYIYMHVLHIYCSCRRRTRLVGRALTSTSAHVYMHDERACETADPSFLIALYIVNICIIITRTTLHSRFHFRVDSSLI